MCTTTGDLSPSKIAPEKSHFLNAFRFARRCTLWLLLHSNIRVSWTEASRYWALELENPANQSIVMLVPGKIYLHIYKCELLNETSISSRNMKMTDDTLFWFIRCSGHRRSCLSSRSWLCRCCVWYYTIHRTSFNTDCLIRWCSHLVYTQYYNFEIECQLWYIYYNLL